MNPDSGQVRGKGVKLTADSASSKLRKDKADSEPYRSVIDKLKELRAERHPLKKLEIVYQAKHLIKSEIDCFYEER